MEKIRRYRAWLRPASLTRVLAALWLASMATSIVPAVAALETDWVGSPPVADFDYEPAKPAVGEEVRFDASRSYDPDELGENENGIIRYQWEFLRDAFRIQIIEEDPITWFAFPEAGIYEVRLTVWDDELMENSCSKPVVVYYLGDINRDGTVDIRDVAIVCKAYGSRPGDENWNPNADLNEDNVVDIRDVALVAKEYGKTLENSGDQ